MSSVTKQALIISAIIDIIMILIGGYFVNMANTDIKTAPKCRSEYWIKGIGYFLIIINIIYLVANIYVYTRA